VDRVTWLQVLVEEMAGVEWWWQETDRADPPKAYHTDCDTRLLADHTVEEAHPAVSSVFYFSGVGGALARLSGCRPLAFRQALPLEFSVSAEPGAPAPGGWADRSLCAAERGRCTAAAGPAGG
jgi:hypothetical protein